MLAKGSLTVRQMLKYVAVLVLLGACLLQSSVTATDDNSQVSKKQDLDSDLDDKGGQYLKEQDVGDDDDDDGSEVAQLEDVEDDDDDEGMTLHKQKYAARQATSRTLRRIRTTRRSSRLRRYRRPTRSYRVTRYRRRSYRRRYYRRYYRRRYYRRRYYRCTCYRNCSHIKRCNSGVCGSYTGSCRISCSPYRCNIRG